MHPSGRETVPPTCARSRTSGSWEKRCRSSTFAIIRIGAHFSQRSRMIGSLGSDLSSLIPIHPA